MIGTIHRDGALYETGPNSALDSTPLINELLDALRIRDERVEASAVAATRYIVRDGRLVPLPTSPGALFMSSAFTPGAKFRLWREPFIAPAPADVEESIAAFARRRLGAEILDYAVDPFVAGVYAGDPERISFAAAFPRLHALEQKYGSVIRGQVQAARERRQKRAARRHRGRQLLLPQRHADADRCARARRRHASRPARASSASSAIADGSVDRRPARATASPSCGARERRARGPGVRGGDASCASSRRRRRKALAAIPYAPIAIVATAYRRADIAHSLAGFGFLVPQREQRKILGSLFSSSMFEGRAPADTVLLTSFVGGMRHPELPARTRRRARGDRRMASSRRSSAREATRCGPRSRAGRTRFRNTISVIASGCARWRMPSARCPGSGSAPTIAAAFRSATA